MKNCTVSYNTAETSGISSADGGGIYAQGKLAMTVCTVKSNMAKTGGGIKKDNDEFTMTNCTLTNNIATANGGGIFTMGTCDFTMANCTLSGNRVNLENNESGGGVYMSGRKFTMKGASCITPSTSLDANKKGQNDVYLAGGKMITVEGTLTPVDGIAARIIVSNGEYSTSTKVLTGDITAGVSPNQNYTKFTVTPQTVPPAKKWTIDEQGKLAEVIGGSNSTAKWTALKNAVESATGGNVFYIEGTYTMPNGTSTINPPVNCTIKGTNNAVLDGNSNGIMINIGYGGSATITLENLTIQNGKNDAYALNAFQGAQFHLKNVTVKDAKQIIASSSGDVTFEDVKALGANSEIKLGEGSSGSSYIEYSYLNIKGNTEITGTVKLAFPYSLHNYSGAIKIFDKKSYRLTLDFGSDYNTAKDQQVVFLDDSVTDFTLADAVKNITVKDSGVFHWHINGEGKLKQGAKP